MKAFLVSLVLLVAITVGAWYGLQQLDKSAADVYTTQSGNVRL